MKNLILTACNLDNESVRVILTSLIKAESEVEFLNLSSNRIDNQAINFLIELLPKTKITTLLLDDNKIDPINAVELMKLKLETLSLSQNEHDDIPIGLVSDSKNKDTKD
jgi:Leucine-rich repeat (LRR) protein